MNRIEAHAKLISITRERIDVHGNYLGHGFFLADAIHVVGDFDRAVRAIRALTNAGRVRCTTVQIGGTQHDIYTATA